MSVDSFNKVIYAKLCENIPKECSLPVRCIEHMAGILTEEPPQNHQEIFDLLQDFLGNAGKLNRNQIWDAVGVILNSLNASNLIKRENKHTLRAERLPENVILKELDFFQDEDTAIGGYEDMFRGVKKAVNTNDDIENIKDARKAKRQDKESVRIAEAYEKHIASIKSQKTKVPAARVKHDKTDTLGKPMDIFIDKLSIIVGGRALLEDTQLKMTHGRKYGLIGRNGIGKTCLMNSLARMEFEKIPRYIQVLLVEQEIEGNEKTALDLVLETDGERMELLAEQDMLAEVSDAAAVQRLQAIYIRLEQIDAASAEARASQILFGLGFTQELLKRKTKHLSGGWRMRVSLARALFVKPDVLLLDEPTNHLDLDAVLWLQEYIIKCNHTVVVVSHAREFLNVVCNEVIHFFDQKLTSYKGNYDQFEKTRSERLGNQKKGFDSQQLKLSHMQDFIDKFRYNAKRASLVQSRIKAIQKMDLIDEVIDDPSCVFIFPEPEKLRPPLLRIEEGIFSYNKDSCILRGVNFYVEMESRMAIVGANGVGKSTLLSLLVETLTLSEGNYYKNPRLRVSLFTQHHLDQLNLMLSPIEQLMTSYPGSSIETYRGHLSSFGLAGNLQLRPQYLLSGGQKSRVAFAMTVWNNPQILIMDEPTNHLDIDAVNALIVALNNFSGGIIIVSHDQYFVSTVCDEIWYIKDQRLKKFHGDFQEYKVALIGGKL